MISDGGMFVIGTKTSSRVFAFAIIASAIATIAFLPAVASAAVATSSVNVTVQSGDNIGNFFALLPPPDTSGGISYQLTGPVNIFSVQNSELLLGTLNGLTVNGDIDPFVTLGFVMTAGAAPIAVSISTGFPIVPIAGGLAFASAGVTATEGGDALDGASVTGLFPGPKAYEASYNLGTGVFADLVSPVVTVPEGGSNTLSERFPVPIGSRTVIPGLVSDIQATFNFTLTAFDQASGTSRFDIIVPEPSSIVLAMCGLVGVLFCARRHRRVR